MPDSTMASSTGTFWMWFCSLPITGWITDENTMRRTPAAAAVATKGKPIPASSSW